MATRIPMPTGLRPPRRLAQLGELSLPLDLLRFGLQWPRLVTAPRGDGRPVYLIPGYGGSELSMRPLEAFLARINYDVADWSLTMGTPIIGGPKYTTPGQRYARSANIQLDRFEREVHDRNSIGFDQPLTVLYSNRDGIVGPDIARDIYNPQARNIRVDGGHMGLGFNPRVWRIIADTLAGNS